MASFEAFNDQMANMGIEDEENEELFLGDDIEEETNKYELCLVGRFLTEKNLNVRAINAVKTCRYLAACEGYHH